MKIIAFILLLLNIGAWWYFQETRIQFIPSPPEPQAALSLRLISELEASEREALRIEPDSNQAGVESEVAPQSSPEPDPLEGLCEVLELPGEDRGGELRERLLEQGLQPRPFEVVSERSGPTLVYIPPFESRSEAAGVLAVLRGEGVDSFIISDGDLVNAISVGIFSNENNAGTKAAELAALGYQTDTTRYQVEERTQYLLVPSGDAALAGDDFWERIDIEFPGVVREQKSCDEVASAPEFQ